MTHTSQIYTSRPYDNAALALLRSGWTLPSNIIMPTTENPMDLEGVNSAIETVEKEMKAAKDGESVILHNTAWLPLIMLRQKLAEEAFSNMPRTSVDFEEASKIIDDLLRAAIKNKTGNSHSRVNDIEGFEDEVALVTACLLDAEGQEHATHGVSRIITYVEAILQNKIKTNGVVRLENEAPGKLSFNGDGTFGQVAVQIALQGALKHMEDLPEDSALMVTMKNAYHAGRLEWILRQAAKKGYNSFALFNVDGRGRSAPHGGAESRLGTNPIAMGVSTGIGQDGIIGDSATTAWAEGAVRIAYLNNLTVPLDVLTTADGNPTVYPAGVYREDGPPDLLLPIGGEVASYKGSVFGTLVKLLVDATSNRAAGDPVGTPGRNNLLLVLHKGEQGTFDCANESARYLASSRPKPGQTVRMPGTGGVERLTFAKQNGLNIASGTWEKVLKLHRDLVK